MISLTTWSCGVSIISTLSVLRHGDDKFKVRLCVKEHKRLVCYFVDEY